MGRIIVPPISSISFCVTNGSGYIAPIPPVILPVSPSPTRLWSREAGNSTKSVPAHTAWMDTSGPSRKSSITTSLPWCEKISRSASSASCTLRQIVTPLPNTSALSLTTIGAPRSRTYAVADGSSENVLNCAVGTPAFSIKVFEKTFDDSICAAALVGPNIFSPATLNTSTIPRSSGFSGPTTVSAISFSCANARSFPTSVAAISTFSPHCDVPPFPGAMYNFPIRGDCESFHASACSRPPLPTRRTSTAIRFDVPHCLLGFLCEEQEFRKRPWKEPLDVHSFELNLKTVVETGRIEKNNRLIVKIMFLLFHHFCYLIEGTKSAGQYDNGVPPI